MPTNRTRTKRFKKAKANDSLIEYFQTGETDEYDTFLLSADDKKMKELWEENKDIIMRDFISEHPFTRPAAWWCFDAPRASRFKGTHWKIRQCEPRLRLDGTILDTGNVIEDLIKGIPSDDEPALYESEFDYLSRHNLLTDSEKYQRYAGNMKLKERYSQ